MDTGFLLDISDNTPYILREEENRGHVIHLKATAEENEMLFNHQDLEDVLCVCIWSIDHIRFCCLGMLLHLLSLFMWFSVILQSSILAQKAKL